MKKIILKKGREKSLHRKHPWIFSGAIEREDRNIENGEIVEIYSSANQWLAKGTYSKTSQIKVRIWTFDEAENIDSRFIKKKILNANKLREKIIPENTNAYRIFFSESDGIPGLIIDKYNQNFVCMFLSAGVEKFKMEIIETIKNEFQPENIYERSDSDVRIKEGLEIFKGQLFGKELPEFTEVQENGIKLLVDIKNGHKTGMYIDQRENRKLLRDFSKGKHVLNCFSYSGGFAVNAILGGADKVVNIDSSQDSLNLSKKIFELNNISEDKYENICADVFKSLRKFKEENRLFDLVILDPPKFADSKSSVEKAARGYKDINMNALNIINSGGYLFTFSCSGLISSELFQKIVADAALDAKREIKFIGQMKQAADHPVSSNFPESLYLKGFIAYVE